MRKHLMVVGLTAAFLLSGGNAIASPGFYIGLEAGSSAPNFSLKNPQVNFEGTTSFLYGAKVGLKFLMFAVEGNVLTASHNIISTEQAFPWEGNGVGFTYWGINGKLFIPLLIVHPYIMGGYGTYSIDINDISKDSNKGYNLGVGLEVKLGKLGVFAEGRYHKVTVTIDRDLDMSNYTLTFGVLYDF
jgi:hypothetical protein